jgi:spermidine/putrescine transport system permease protein
LVFWLFSLPPTLWLIAFFLVPLAFVWLLSFGEKQGIIEIAITGTLDNYARALHPLYLWIFAKSIGFAGLTTLICLVIALPIAVAMAFASPRWKALLLLLIMLPFWTNLLIRTYALIAVLRTKGYVNASLEFLWNTATRFLHLVGLGDTGLLGIRFEPLELLYNNFAVMDRITAKSSGPATRRSRCGPSPKPQMNVKINIAEPKAKLGSLITSCPSVA